MAQHAAQPAPFLDPPSHSYAAGTFRLDVQVAYLDMVAISLVRAPGTAVASFVLECAVDELAVALDMDPIELRMRNEPDKDPTDGRSFSSRHVIEAWRAGAERFGWSGRRSTPGAVPGG